MAHQHKINYISPTTSFSDKRCCCCSYLVSLFLAKKVDPPGFEPGAPASLWYEVSKRHFFTLQGRCSTRLSYRPNQKNDCDCLKFSATTLLL